MKTKLILTSLIVFSAYFLITVPALAGDLVTVAPPCEFRESDINEVNKARTHHNRSVYQNQGFAVDFGVDGFTPLSCVGRDVFASISGRVTRITDKTVPGGGQMLRIVNPTTGIEVHYLHLANYNGSPANGGFVQQGQKVATIGNTGGTLKEPYPTHLHFEVHRNGQKLSYKSLQDNSNKAEEWRFGNYGVQGPNLSRYDFTYDSQGWQIANAMNFVFDGGRQPRYQITSNDPFFVSPSLSLSRVDYRFVEVDVEYNGGFPDFSCVRLYVMETGDTSFSENKAYSISSSVRISDKRGKVIFDMGQQTNRSIFINRLRLDPACGGNPVITLHGIRLYNDLQAKAVYRFWSDKHQNHFYTADDNEKNDVLAKYSQSTWKYERVAFHAFDANINYPVSAGLYPVFRFWNNTLQGHFYTIDPNEAKDLVNHPERGWVFEFEAFQAFKAPYQNYTVPLHRFWSNSLQAHFFTTDEAEKNDLINNPGKGWTYEGVAFHVLP